jgi:hypothetical protein
MTLATDVQAATPGVNLIQFLFFVTDAPDQKARLFATSKPLQPSLMFEGKEAPEKGQLR